MASMRRNMFHKNEKQETTEIDYSRYMCRLTVFGEDDEVGCQLQVVLREVGGAERLRGGGEVVAVVRRLVERRRQRLRPRRRRRRRTGQAALPTDGMISRV
ncbi:hypothetical protein AAG570_007161 [Ranatra chinensis]|uniref:Uncharacterized protein n=1 Tax=Ranatra chinensis TaxID=642074 RepID=A0ABD0YIW2_9HEMI